VDLLEHLRRQFAYDAWANREVLTGLRVGARPVARPSQLLSHIISAERLWLERIRKQPQSLPVWPDFTLDECEEQISNLAQLWRGFLGQLSPTGLEEKVAYKNSKGEPWTSTVQDVLCCCTPRIIADRSPARCGRAERYPPTRILSTLRGRA